jgi:glycosyltransferase involved in cell wall biosynthesis
MLRVAIDATPLLGDRTGVGVFVDGALSALPGHDLALQAFGLTWEGRKLLPELLPAGIRAARIAVPAGPMLRLWSVTDHPVAEWWTGSVDVVHGTNFVVPPTRRAARVVTVHDLTAVRFPQLCTPTSLRYPKLVRRAIGDGAFVHTPSAFVASEVIEVFGAEPDRVVAIQHGVDTEVVSSMRGSGPPTIVAIGTVEPRKDFPTLVRAFDAVAATHRDVLLVIAGPDGWGQEALADAIDAAVHRDRIQRRGWVDDQERSRLLAEAAVFAFPSRYEGFGLPLLEAMAAGVPVVTTSAGAIPEVAGDAALLSAPGDVNALASNLIAALDDTGCRQRLIDSGRARCRSFTWSSSAEAYTKLYRRAAESR